MIVFTTTMAVGGLLCHLRLEIGEGLGQRHTGRQQPHPFALIACIFFISSISLPWRIGVETGSYYTALAGLESGHLSLLQPPKC